MQPLSVPVFVSLAESGELEERAAAARESLAACRLCPRECGVDRLAGELGYCRAGRAARVYRHMPHPGEEPPISGTNGSGTIFWSHCTMSCCYCQNYRMSQHGDGADRTIVELAAMMSRLWDAGCHNINHVSPTQFLPHVLESLVLAWRRGVLLPVVWNTSGYESRFALGLLDGVVDVYLSDVRYSSGDAAGKYSDAPDYVPVSRIALAEMHRQVGDLICDRRGVAERGLIVRHLVLPNGHAGTRDAMRFIARELGARTHVSLMAQYYPACRALEFPELARRITREEWAEAQDALESAGLEHGWVQDYPEDLSPIAGTEITAD
ncbi:MAG: radical SAM protein [Candidatus Eisenbacteria bacterium]